MKLLEYRHFPGINIHCYKPALEAVVDLEELYGHDTSLYPEFNQTLLELLPGLKEHVCGIGRRGGFLIKLNKGTYFGHVVEHVAIELLNLAGYQSSYGKTRAIAERQYRLVIQCHWPQTALLALEMAMTLVGAAVRGEEVELEIEKLAGQLAREKPGPSTQAIIDAATSRGIPVTLSGYNSLIRLGTGKYRQYVQATVTEKTSCIGVDIACDKTLTKKILAAALIPTPKGQIARDEEQAVVIAAEMGVPAVIKPCEGNQGKGVSLNLTSEAQVRAAYKVAENYGKVLVEEQIFGRHYRILVIGGKIVAAARRFPAVVVGNGIDSIKDLIEIENSDPLRGEEHEKPLTKIKVDQIVFNVLARQNLTMNYIPNQQEVICLRDNANLSTGGTAADVTDEVHPENITLAARIARLLGLDVAGIDIVTEDIAKPMLAGQGAVIEVNAAPGIRMHLFPSQGLRRPVGDAIVDYLFPWQKPHSVPIVSITGTNGKTTTARLVTHVLAGQGKIVGLASTDGIEIAGDCVDEGDNTGRGSAEAILADPAVEVAVLETARGGLVRRGLGYGEANVAVVTNIANDHLGCDGIETLAELAHVKALVVETVSIKGFAILSADDEAVVSLAKRCPGQIIFFSCRERNKTLARHLAMGGRGVMVQGGKITFIEGSKAEQVVPVASVPITMAGAAEYNTANCLAAAGALWALGADLATIAKGFAEFKGNTDNPGRGNIYDCGSYRILVDYGHNYAGYEAVLKLMARLKPARKVGIVGMPGDRLDRDILATGVLCGQGFDKIYIKEDKDLRGRKLGEVADILVAGIKRSSAVVETRVIRDEAEALQEAIATHHRGDIIAIFYEELPPIQRVIDSCLAEAGTARNEVVDSGR